MTLVYLDNGIGVLGISLCLFLPANRYELDFWPRNVHSFNSNLMTQKSSAVGIYSDANGIGFEVIGTLRPRPGC